MAALSGRMRGHTLMKKSSRFHHTGFILGVYKQHR